MTSDEERLREVEQAMREVEEALKRHGCRIVTVVGYERIGHGDRGIVESHWAVVPEVKRCESSSS